MLEEIGCEPDARSLRARTKEGTQFGRIDTALDQRHGVLRRIQRRPKAFCRIAEGIGFRKA
jgi:hypothetical protein